MPLQNRVTPDGTIVAAPQRGLFMGNRGGQFHDPDTRTLAGRTRWKTKSWIICTLEFKVRKRTLMDHGNYTELFFLDEVTALAAGHRPCFECQRAKATEFSQIWQHSLGGEGRMRVSEMDAVLHTERCSAKGVRPILCRFNDVPEGAIIHDGKQWIARHGKRALRWSLDGYSPVDAPSGEVELVTPPCIADHVLSAGYKPTWHPSAEIT